MPIYEYQCDSCDHVIEAFQTMADPPLATCPSCAGSLRKLVSASSFVLKGGGWYADGYASKGNGNGNGKGKTASGKASEGAVSKPAADSGKTAAASTAS
ncbi:MAG: zinc ribbon domain-containing protein [Thermodesulfobacteriota bacterium]